MTTSEFLRNPREINCTFWYQKLNFTTETYNKEHEIFGIFMKNKILSVVIYI